MAKTRFKLLSAVHLFLIQNGKVLLLRRYNTGYEDGKYSVPAGHLDGNEPVTVAMAREASEEIGLNLDPAELEVVHVMHRRASDADDRTNERVDFYLTVRRWEGEPRIMELDKCDDLVWHPLEQLPSNTILYIQAALDSFLGGEYYSEFGWTASEHRELALSHG